MICPQCEHPRMKTWEELDSNEKFIVERLPPSAEYTRKERQTHLFCPRCRHEAIIAVSTDC